MEFEWDPRKNEANIAKHGIDFRDAIEVFRGFYLERVDDRLDYGEERMIAYGEASGRVVVVVYVWRGDRRRMVSARKAARLEMKLYYEVVHGK